MTLIKDVGKYSIYFEEDTVESNTWRAVLITVALVSTYPLALALYIYYGIEGPWIGIGSSIAMGLGIGNVFANFGATNNPAYIVRLSDHYSSAITIIKTTPEADQKAICEATQKLEKIALETIKKDNELKAIAEKCK